MENILNDNWDELGKKVSEYVPDEFSPDDWAEMEKMLEDAPVNTGFRINGSMFLKGLGFLFILSVAAYFIIQQKENEMEVGSATSEEIMEINRTIGQSEKLSKIESFALNEINKSNKEEGVLNGKNNEKIRQNNSTKAEYSDGGTIRNSIVDNGSNFIGDNNLMIKNDNSDSNDLKSYENIKDFKLINSEKINQEMKEEKLENKILSENDFVDFSNISYLSFMPLKTISTEEGEVEAAKLNVKIPVQNESFNSRVRFGALVGLNNTITDYSSLTTSHLPYLGVFANKRMSPKWEVQVEAHLKVVNNYDVLQQWENKVYSSTGLVGTEKVEKYYEQYTSIDVPVVLKYYVSNRFNAIGGARFSHLGVEQSGASGVRVSGTGGAEISLYQRTPNYGFWEYDVNLVLGMEYYLTSKWLLDMRLNQGFLDITPDNLYQDNAVHLNSDLQFSLRYIF